MNQQAPLSPAEIEQAIGISSGARRARRWKWLIVAALAVIAAALAAQYHRSQQSAGPQLIYDTAEAATRDVIITITATGTIEPITQVEVGSELSGIARDVLVNENDLVAEGQVLARLDTTRLAAQRQKAAAQLSASEARLQSAKVSLLEQSQAQQRQEQLRRRGLSTAQVMEQASADLQRAQAQILSAEADIATARAELALVEADLGKTAIRSPISGTVLKRSLEPGQTVAASLQAPVLFTIAEDLRRIQVEADVDEADVGQVKTDQKADFTVEAFRDRKFEGRVSRLSFSPDTEEGVVTYKTILNASNEDFALRPGMTATTRITVETFTNVLTVPNEALRYTPPREQASQGFSITQLFMPRFPRSERGQRTSSPDGMRAIYILDGTAAKELRVKTGASDGKVTVIAGGDLKPGDKVVTAARPATR